VTIRLNARWTRNGISSLAGKDRLFGHFRKDFLKPVIPFVWAVFLLLFISIEDSNPNRASTFYDYTMHIYRLGNLAKSQQEAEEGFWQFRVSNPDWAAKFELLQAEIMVQRGMFNDALFLLADYHTDNSHPEEIVRKLAIEADALTRQRQFLIANQKLTQADNVCKTRDIAYCGYILSVHGILSVMQDHILDANRYFFQCLSFAQAHQDGFLEARASLNLGWLALQINRYDEAVVWSQSAYQAAMKFNADDLAQVALGNLGWAYFQLGDDERALEEFLEAEKGAKRLGDTVEELKCWTVPSSYHGSRRHLF
jgi:tetratricopeptide (TPR) repeat protein